MSGGPGVKDNYYDEKSQLERKWKEENLCDACTPGPFESYVKEVAPGMYSINYPEFPRDYFTNEIIPCEHLQNLYKEVTIELSELLPKVFR